jgi:phosphoribosylanthranilate isomerase
MPRLIIQIYEIQTPAEAEALIALGVDHIGSVLVAGEPWKRPELKDTIAVVQAGGCKSCLIPLCAAPETVLRALDYYSPDIAHFCDVLPPGEDGLRVCDELIALQARVQRQFPAMGVMRSIPIAPPGFAREVPTLDLARRFEGVSDFFLTDTLLPENRQPVSGFIGITGQPCDWNLAGRLVRQATIPVILAGGLGPKNVAEAIAQARPNGVDSCTQTNARDAHGRLIRFRKDFAKVGRFVEAVRRAEMQLNSNAERTRIHVRKQ